MEWIDSTARGQAGQAMRRPVGGAWSAWRARRRRARHGIDRLAWCGALSSDGMGTAGMASMARNPWRWWARPAWRGDGSSAEALRARTGMVGIGWLALQGEPRGRKARNRWRGHTREAGRCTAGNATCGMAPQGRQGEGSEVWLGLGRHGRQGDARGGLEGLAPEGTGRQERPGTTPHDGARCGLARDGRHGVLRIDRAADGGAWPARHGRRGPGPLARGGRAGAARLGRRRRARRARRVMGRFSLARPARRGLHGHCRGWEGVAGMGGRVRLPWQLMAGSATCGTDQLVWAGGGTAGSAARRLAGYAPAGFAGPGMVPIGSPGRQRSVGKAWTGSVGRPGEFSKVRQGKTRQGRHGDATPRRRGPDRRGRQGEMGPVRMRLAAQAWQGFPWAGAVRRGWTGLARTD